MRFKWLIGLGTAVFGLGATSLYSYPAGTSQFVSTAFGVSTFVAGLGIGVVTLVVGLSCFGTYAILNRRKTVKRTVHSLQQEAEALVAGMKAATPQAPSRTPPHGAIPAVIVTDPEALGRWKSDFREKFSHLVAAEREGASRTFDEAINDVSGALTRLFSVDILPWSDEVRRCVVDLLKFVEDRLWKDSVSAPHKVRYVNWLRVLYSKNDEQTNGWITAKFQERMSLMFQSQREFELVPDFVILLQNFNGHNEGYMTSLADAAIRWDSQRFGLVRVWFEFKKMTPDSRRRLVQHLFQEKLKFDRLGDRAAFANADALYQDAKAAELQTG